MKSTAKNATWESAVFEQGVGENNWNQFLIDVQTTPKEITVYNSTANSFLYSDGNLTEVLVKDSLGVTNYLTVSANTELSEMGVYEGGSLTQTLDLSVQLPLETGSLVNFQFSNDGSKLFYHTKTTNTTIYELTTPFDLSTVVEQSPRVNTTSQFNNRYGSSISSDGRFIIVKSGATILQSYELTTPWDLTTVQQIGTYDLDSWLDNNLFSSSYLYYSNQSLQGNEVVVSPDGKNIIVALGAYLAVSDDYYENLIFIELDSPWQVSSAFNIRSYEIYKNLSWVPTPRSPSRLSVTNDGKKLYCLAAYSQSGSLRLVTTYQIDMPSPWDTTDIVKSTPFGTPAAEEQIQFFNGFYFGCLLGGGNDDIKKYENANTEGFFTFDVSSASLTTAADAYYYIPDLTFSTRFSPTSIDTVNTGTIIPVEVSNNDVTFDLDFNEYTSQINVGDTLFERYNTGANLIFDQSGTSVITGANGTNFRIWGGGTITLENGETAEKMYGTANNTNGFIAIYYYGNNFTDFSVSGSLRADSITSFYSLFDNGQKAIWANVSSLGYLTYDDNQSLEPTTSTSFSITNYADDFFRSMVMSSDGTKLFAGDASGNVYSWELETAYSPGTANSVTIQNFDYVGSDIIRTMNFSPDGKKLFLGTFTSNTLYEFILDNPWDISSKTQVSTIVAGANGLPWISATDGKYYSSADHSVITITSKRFYIEQQYSVTNVSGSGNNVITLDSEPSAHTYFAFDTPFIADIPDYTAITQIDDYDFINSNIKIQTEYALISPTARHAKFKIVANRIGEEVKSFSVNLKKDT